MIAARSVEVHALLWRGVDIEISFERNWLGGDPNRPHATAHLTITAKVPDRARLPITETGFRSHFVPAYRIDEAGGPVAYVDAWVNDMARSREWIAYEQASRQLSLF